MKEFFAKSIFIIIDIFIIFISLLFAYLLRNIFANNFGGIDSYPLTNYTRFYPIYIVTIALFVYEGIYNHRYDFWHESRIIIKSLVCKMRQNDLRIADRNPAPLLYYGKKTRINYTFPGAVP